MIPAERLTKLTDMAQKRWHAFKEVRVEVANGRSRVTYLSDFPLQTLDGPIEEYPRCTLLEIPDDVELHALEAAILVLEGKDQALSLTRAKDVWGDAFETAKKLFCRPNGLAYLEFEARWNKRALDLSVTNEQAAIEIQQILGEMKKIVSW